MWAVVAGHVDEILSRFFCLLCIDENHVDAIVFRYVYSQSVSLCYFEPVVADGSDVAFQHSHFSRFS